MVRLKEGGDVYKLAQGYGRRNSNVRVIVLTQSQRFKLQRSAPVGAPPLFDDLQPSRFHRRPSRCLRPLSTTYPLIQPCYLRLDENLSTPTGFFGRVQRPSLSRATPPSLDPELLRVSDAGNSQRYPSLEDSSPSPPSFSGALRLQSLLQPSFLHPISPFMRNPFITSAGS